MLIYAQNVKKASNICGSNSLLIIYRLKMQVMSEEDKKRRAVESPPFLKRQKMLSAVDRERE
jgi:hypothetical protein